MGEQIMKQQFQQVECALAEVIDPNQRIVVSSHDMKDELLLPKICHQIEYYLGDANLTRDHYFTKILRENSNYVPLDEFLKCHRIKELMLHYPKGFKQQIAILALALKRSKLLKLDRHETKVKRKVEFKKNSGDLDSRTIYVENLPPECDNALLYKIFSNIEKHIVEAYVCRHKPNQSSKGFGFVTFLNKGSVESAMAQYQNCLPKEIINLGITGTGLRIITKAEWKWWKQHTKQLLKEIQAHEKVVQQESKPLRLEGLDDASIRVEEVRAALGHAIDHLQVVHINHEAAYWRIQCADNSIAYQLKQNIHRIQHYDQRFRKCSFI